MSKGQEPSILFTLCTSRLWKEAIAYVKAHPEDAIKLQQTGKRGAAPITALQTALANVKCRGDVPIELIEELLKESPDLAVQRHIYTGNLPMHAVFYNPFYSAAKRTQIAQLILQASGPKSITMKNNDGRTPLHTICSQHCNFEPLSILLKAAPPIASWEDDHGDLPIHLACRSMKSPLKSIVALYEAYPKGIVHKNLNDMTPLDAAFAIGAANNSSSASGNSPLPASKGRNLIHLLMKLQASFMESKEGVQFKKCGGMMRSDELEEAKRKRKGTSSKRKKSIEVIFNEPSRDDSQDARDDVEDFPPPTKRPRRKCSYSSRPSSPDHVAAFEIREAEDSSAVWSWIEEISPNILISMKRDSM